MRPLLGAGQAAEGRAAGAQKSLPVVRRKRVALGEMAPQTAPHPA